jgi:competence protein ComEC
VFARLSLIAAVALLAALAGFGLTRAFAAKGARLTFLSVGQGDCTVWRDGDTVILVDVGPKTKQGYDAGQRIVLPKLRKMGIQQVAMIFLTHPDSDHIGGLKAVHARFPNARIVASAGFRENSEMVKWLREAGVDSKEVIWIEGRSRIKFDDSIVEVAAPAPPAGASDNDGSLFIRIQHGVGSVVLTGDASIPIEEAMQATLRWKAQILKAGHHGSRTASGESLISGVGPTWSVISCGRENSFGHPHRSVLDTLRRHDVEVFRTDKQGDIAFDVDSTGFRPLQEQLSD